MDVVAIIPAGQYGKIPGGNFIYCREATHNDFEIQPDGGAKVAFHQGAEESFPDSPSEFRIWNSGADLTATFRIKAGGQYRDNRLLLEGDVNVGNFPATFGDGLTEITRAGYGTIGASSALIHNCATGNNTLIPAASNTNGMIIRTLFAYSPTAQMTLSAHTGVMTALGQGRALLTCYQGLAGSNIFPSFYVPSGLGLYFFANTTDQSVATTFDLL